VVDYKASTQGGKGTLSLIYSDGESKTLQSNHPAYTEVLTYLVATPEDQHDEDLLREMSNPALRLGRLLKAVDPRFDFDTFTLSFEGLPLTGALVDLIKDRLNNGKGDWERFARFLARLETNPSFGAKKALYSFVSKNGLHILADGRFVGHKAVGHDGKSQSAGPNNFINGVLYGKPGESVHVPHYVGMVVSKRRGDVDDSAMACSTGLHVGSLSYASGFAPVLLTVVVAPEDVVGGEYGDKFRTERYEVVGINERKEEFVGEDYEIVDRSGVLTPGEKEFAEGCAILSRDHQFTDEERVQYNSLPSVGRTLYDRLRTVLNKTHALAYETALADFGTHEEWIAKRDAEREQAAAEQAAATPDPVVEEALSEIEDDEVDNSHLASLSTMDEKAQACEALAADLARTDLGHKPLARQWADAGVTEASVRRYRKAKGVSLNLGTRVRDALS
jgi:hypothetical protein